MTDEDSWADGIDYSHRQHTRHQGAGIQTGGIFDDVTGAVGGAYDAVAGVGDWAAGSTDEAIARTFDDEPGGGIIHGFQEFMPFMSQPDSVTQRQIDQGVIDEPDGWSGSGQDQQQQSGNNGEFDRSGTPTTDGQGQNQNQDGSGSGMGDGQMKTLAMVGGAVLAGGYALTKVSSSDSERSVPDLHRETPRERGNRARSNRGKSAEEKSRGQSGKR